MTIPGNTKGGGSSEAETRRSETSGKRFENAHNVRSGKREQERERIWRREAENEGNRFLQLHFSLKTSCL